MQVDVVDVFRTATGIFERESHRARGFVTIFSKTNAMISITSRAVAKYLCVNVRAAVGRVFEFL